MGYLGKCTHLGKTVQILLLLVYLQPNQLFSVFKGVGGSVQYPKGYIANAFKKVRAHGGLCISDEVQTGFGRTGE